jgi:hypothetical protein
MVPSITSSPGPAHEDPQMRREPLAFTAITTEAVGAAESGGDDMRFVVVPRIRIG